MIIHAVLQFIRRLGRASFFIAFYTRGAFAPLPPGAPSHRSRHPALMLANHSYLGYTFKMCIANTTYHRKKEYYDNRT